MPIALAQDYRIQWMKFLVGNFKLTMVFKSSLNERTSAFGAAQQQ
jgi:hypothetical protein